MVTISKSIKLNGHKLLLSYAMCNRSETLLCDSLPKTRSITYGKDFPNFNTFEDIRHLLMSLFSTNKKIAITHLWHAMGPQTMYHLIFILLTYLQA